MTTKYQLQKQQALDFFVGELLKGSKAKDVEKIVLYGSLAWGKPSKESDIDVAIFSRAPKKLEKVVDKVSFETMMKFGESVEPVLYSKRDLSSPRSYLSWLVLQKGEPVFDREEKHEYGR